MRRVSCPKCDAKVKVPDDHERSYIRCKSCDKKIDLDDDEDEDERPRRSSNSRRKKKDEAGGFLAYLPLLVVVPLLSCPCLAYAHRAFGAAGAILGLAAFLAAAIKIYLVIKSKNLSSWEDIPWYLRGGGALLYYQIKYAIAMPKEIGTWLVLEIVGLVVMIASGTISEGKAKLEANQEIERRHKEAMEAMNKGGAGPGAQGKGQDKNPAQADAVIDKAVADLDSRDANVVRVAADVLFKTAPNQNQAMIAKRLAARIPHENPLTEGALVKALAVWATPVEVPTLIGVVENKSAMTRGKAIEALGNLKDERAIAPLARAFREPGGSRREIGNALRQFGPAAEKEVLALLNDDKAFLQIDVINLLKDIGTQMSVPALQALANGNNPLVRNAARDAVAAINARGK